MTPLAKHLQRHLGNRTYAEVAAALGVHRSAVMYWMRGDRVPSRAHLRALCDLLGIDEMIVRGYVEGEIAARAVIRWRES